MLYYNIPPETARKHIIYSISVRYTYSYTSVKYTQCILLCGIHIVYSYSCAVWPSAPSCATRVASSTSSRVAPTTSSRLAPLALVQYGGWWLYYCRDHQTQHYILNKISLFSLLTFLMCCKATLALVHDVWFKRPGSITEVVVSGVLFFLNSLGLFILEPCGILSRFYSTHFCTCFCTTYEHYKCVSL